ncbi:MAG: hypothetical protein SGILL_002956 [Bacillariaceae sp.]
MKSLPKARAYALLVILSSLFWQFCLADQSEFQAEAIHNRRRLVVVGEQPGPGAGLDSVAGGSYQPQTRILDQQRIGLDQQELTEKLDVLAFEDALALYQEGGHSGSVATISLITPSETSIQQRSIVLGTSEAGEPVRSVVQKYIPPLSTLMDVAYPVSKGTLPCFVGGKADPITDGCLSSSEMLLVAGEEVSAFSYDALQNTRNSRTLQGMATETLFRDCDQCPLETHLKYINYYGIFTYADDMILAAFRQTATNLNTNNADFSQMSPEGRSATIQRLTLTLVVWIYSVGMMEYGLEKCQLQNPTDTGTAEWDSAVAFYIGTETNSTGLLYGLADELCPTFNTCDEAGIARVNREIMEQFTSGQTLIAKGLCAEATDVKDRIVSLMTIPLVQGTLYFSYLLRGSQDEEALGAAYAFISAILPLLDACGSDGVGIIASSVSIPPPDAAGATDFFALVKGFIEEEYECLGITCGSVGTLDGADLCVDRESDDLLDDFVPTDDDASASGMQVSVWASLTMMILSISR